MTGPKLMDCGVRCWKNGLQQATGQYNRISRARIKKARSALGIFDDHRNCTQMISDDNLESILLPRQASFYYLNDCSYKYYSLILQEIQTIKKHRFDKYELFFYICNIISNIFHFIKTFRILYSLTFSATA